MQTITSNKAAAISAAHQSITNEGEKSTFIQCIEDYAKRAQTPQEFNAAVSGHLGALASVGFLSLAQSLLSAIQTETANLEAVNNAALEKASEEALPKLEPSPTISHNLTPSEDMAMPQALPSVTASTQADTANTAEPGGPELGKSGVMPYSDYGQGSPVSFTDPHGSFTDI